MATVMVYVVDSFPARPKNKITHHAQLTSPSRASCHGPSLAKCLLICSCRPACRGDGPMGPPLLPLLRLCMVVVGYSTRYIFDSDLGCLAATLDSILCYFGFSPKREDCEEERQHKMCRERGRDKQKSAPFRRAIHYSCAVFAATEVMLGLKRRLAGVGLHR